MQIAFYSVTQSDTMSYLLYCKKWATVAPLLTHLPTCNRVHRPSGPRFAHQDEPLRDADPVVVVLVVRRDDGDLAPGLISRAHVSTLLPPRHSWVYRIFDMDPGFER